MLARHDACLVRDWPTQDQGMEIDPSSHKDLFHLCGLGIVSQRSYQPCLDPQPRQVNRDIACSSRSLPFALNFN